jgi:hypothetical protein
LESKPEQSAFVVAGHDEAELVAAAKEFDEGAELVLVAGGLKVDGDVSLADVDRTRCGEQIGEGARLRTAWNGRSGIACDFPVPASIAVSERLLGIFRDRGSSTGG